MISTTLAERWEAIWLSTRLRCEDAREVRTATGGLSPEEVVPLSFDISTQVYTIRPATPFQVDVHPVAMFGVGDDPANEGLGLVWLLATKDMHRGKRGTLQSAPHFLNAMSRDYPLGLHNYVDDRNRTHLAWCKAVGLLPLETVDVNGFPFHHVYRPRPQELFSV
jgi:hypothetical protein